MAFDGEAERCCSSRAHRAGDLPHPWPEGHDRCRSRRTVRFPTDFMFQLTRAEAASLRSQIVILERGRGKHRKYLPYAFTQEGVAMLSSVLRSPRAVQVNIAIIRAFVRLRRMLTTNESLARKLDALERKYDAQFKVVFDAIRQLMSPPAAGRRTIGFRARACGGRQVKEDATSSRKRRGRGLTFFYFLAFPACWRCSKASASL